MQSSSQRRLGSMNADVCAFGKPLSSWILNQVQDDGLSGPSLHISFTRLAELEVADRPQFGVLRIVQHRAVDPHLVGPRIGAERIAVPQDDVGHLSGLQAARLLENAE